MGRFTLFLGIFLLIFAVSTHPSYADKPGERRYNYATKKMEFYDGTNWYNFNLGVPLGGCTKEGEMEFNNLLSLYQYCNGSNWIRLIGSITLSGCSPKAKMDYFNNTYMYCNGLVWVNMKGLLVL
jgi:hypothetical protein